MSRAAQAVAAFVRDRHVQPREIKMDDTQDPVAAPTDDMPEAEPKQQEQKEETMPRKAKRPATPGAKKRGTRKGTRKAAAPKKVAETSRAGKATKDDVATIESIGTHGNRYIKLGVGGDKYVLVQPVNYAGAEVTEMRDALAKVLTKALGL